MVLQHSAGGKISCFTTFYCLDPYFIFKILLRSLLFFTLIIFDILVFFVIAYNQELIIVLPQLLKLYTCDSFLLGSLD